MALQLIEGYENDRLPAGFAFTTNTTTPTFTGGRLSGRALWLYWGAVGSSEMTATAPVPTPVGALCVGVAARWTGAAAGTGTTRLLQLREGTTTHLAVIRNAAGFLQLIRGDGTVLATAAVAIDLSAWNHLDLAATIDDTNGRATLKINGAQVLTVTGADTRNGGTAGLISQVVLATAVIGNNAGQLLVDDWYVTDTTGPAPYNGSLGDCKVEQLRPTANGAASAWVGSDANSVDNWQLVDDVAVTTDYVGSLTVGARDLYELSDPTGLAQGDVLAVQVEMLAAKSDAGDAPGPLLAATRSVGGTVSTSVVAAPAQLSTTYQWFRGPIMVADPAGDPWNLARVAGLQAGPEIGTP